MNEFELIARYFTRPPRSRSVALGVGDDAALVVPTPGCEVAVSVDMLVEGRHFVAGADPEALGHKTLAVNLSDLAAMGATPRWALLAGSLPDADPAWLQAFARGFLALADANGVDLVGGDTTRGPRNLCVTIIGEVPAGRALTRGHAKPGDDVWVSGTLGDAALAVAALAGRTTLAADALSECRRRLDRPEPRVALGLALRGVATAAIDLSDGLTGDLGHVLDRSHVGARVELAAVPRSPALAAKLASARARARARMPARRRRRLRAPVHGAACERCAGRGDRDGPAAAARAHRLRRARSGARRDRRERRGIAAPPAGLRPFSRRIEMSAAAPALRFLVRHPAHFIALGFGAGLSPFAPGTFGTLVAIPLAAVLRAYSSDAVFLAAIIALALAGVWAAGVTGRALGVPDHGSIVIDEVVAFLLVLWFVGGEPFRIALAFLLFRLFDILKPPPIRQLDAALKNGVGVMLDDLLAAGYTLLALALGQWLLA